ncbi:MAG: rhomboid family intramembrane serine protease [Chitinophagales bacterium]|nr:rhomboid family intramembrane serine protease [Chitinophagales bacterium]
MLFPIGDDQIQGGYRPVVSYSLIVLNVLIFLFEASMGNTNLEAFIMHYGAIPAEITSGQDYYTLISSMFLHGSWMHLIGNMLFLWVFADNIEAVIGNFHFMVFYLLGGIVAALTHILLAPGSNVPMVGASGAISAVMGAYVIMFPRSRVKVFFVVFFTSFNILALYFLGFWILQQVISGMSSLNANDLGEGVAWWAHIGGFAFGVLAGLYFKKTRPMLQLG